MKTLLLNLPKNIDDRWDFDQIIQPYGLACISSFMKQNGLDVELFDAGPYRMTRKQIIRHVIQSEADILGLSVMTYALPVIASFIRDLKEVLPSITIVVGGPHIFSETESTMRHHPEVDICCTSEGEEVMVDLVDALQKGRDLAEVKGISYRKDGLVITNPARGFLKDLDAYPFADWDALPMDKYWDVFTTKQNYARFMGSRGCPYACTFCDAPRVMGKKLRRRSPESIVGELTYLYDKFNVREFLFGDSTLNVNRNWLNEVCEGLINMDRPMIWRASLRADRLEREQLLLMKRAGCAKIVMGIESGDEDALIRMKKGETLDEIKKGLEVLKTVDIESSHGFVLGMPGDTVQSIRNTIQFAKEIDTAMCSFSLATPFPGTEFHEQAQEEGVEIDDWSKFDFYGVPYVPQGMTEKELRDLYKECVRTFYFRPKYLWARVKGLKSWTNFKIQLWYAFRIFIRSFTIQKVESKDKDSDDGVFDAVRATRYIK